MKNENEGSPAKNLNPQH